MLLTLMLLTLMLLTLAHPIGAREPAQKSAGSRAGNIHCSALAAEEATEG